MFESATVEAGTREKGLSISWLGWDDSQMGRDSVVKESMGCVLDYLLALTMTETHAAKTYPAHNRAP